MYRIAVCDDELCFVESIAAIVDEYCREHSIISVITKFTNSEELFEEIEESQYYDIFILDIEMPKYDGMKLATQIRKILCDSIIIFVTSHIQYAVEGYEYDIFRYIPKQLMKERLPFALRDAWIKLEIQNVNVYTISMARKYQKVQLKDIYYIYKYQKNAVFILQNGVIKVRKPLYQIYEEINSEDFLFIDRCYIVNIVHIERIFEGKIIFENGSKVNTSDSHILEVKKYMSTFWGKRI